MATYGGGTGLATQRECLEADGLLRQRARCASSPRSWRASVLCGELSLGSAIVAEEWVDAHDLLGRNRP